MIKANHISIEFKKNSTKNSIRNGIGAKKIIYSLFQIPP